MFYHRNAHYWKYITRTIHTNLHSGPQWLLRISMTQYPATALHGCQTLLNTIWAFQMGKLNSLKTTLNPPQRTTKMPKNAKMAKETSFGLKLFKGLIQSTQNRVTKDISAGELWFVLSIRFYGFFLYNKKNITRWLKSWYMNSRFSRHIVFPTRT